MKQLETRELRIGNYVIFEDNVCMVTMISKSKVTVSRKTKREICSKTLTSVCDISPIPLTEEWLEKFGLVKDGYFWLGEIEELYDFTVRFLFDIHFIKYFYVHQLQNLYYALTGRN